MLYSTRTGKTGSNWLDRLRSSKGIPTGDDLDLDSFLLSTNSHSLSPQARPNNPTRPRQSETYDPPMSMILAELFNTGTTLTLTSKKCPRKQTNPKFFLASSSTNSVNVPATIPVSSPTPVTAGDDAVAEEVEEDRGDEEEIDLKGFTRSEVTMIDTSCPVWKVDKFVYRKNSVWKVRERKPKTKFFAKKNNLTHEIDVNGIGTSKDNVVNMSGEKPVKTRKVI